MRIQSTSSEGVVVVEGFLEKSSRALFVSTVVPASHLNGGRVIHSIKGKSDVQRIVLIKGEEGKG